MNGYQWKPALTKSTLEEIIHTDLSFLTITTDEEIDNESKRSMMIPEGYDTEKRTSRCYAEITPDTFWS